MTSLSCPRPLAIPSAFTALFSSSSRSVVRRHIPLRRHRPELATDRMSLFRARPVTFALCRGGGGAGGSGNGSSAPRQCAPGAADRTGPARRCLLLTGGLARPWSVYGHGEGGGSRALRVAHRRRNVESSGVSLVAPSLGVLRGVGEVG